GVMLYEMITGRKPFTGDSVITITYNIMNLDPIAPSGIPPAVQSIIRRAMAKDPSQRYRDAAAMARDMETALSQPSAVISPPPTSGPIPTPQTPRPAVNSQQPADPFSLLQPDDLALQTAGYAQATYGYQRRPRRPLLSPVARAWFGALLLAVVAAGM